MREEDAAGADGRPLGLVVFARVLRVRGAVGELGEVNPDHLVRFEQAELAGDRRTEVAAVREVAVVAEEVHDRRPGARDAGHVPPALVRRSGESKPGQRRDHEVKAGVVERRQHR